MSADFFIFVAEDTNVSDVDGSIVAFGICGTDAMGISGLEKAWNTLDLVPISKILKRLSNVNKLRLLIS